MLGADICAFSQNMAKELCQRWIEVHIVTCCIILSDDSKWVEIAY
jgi:hypothetical protein